jgi:hypothetical protein
MSNKEKDIQPSRSGYVINQPKSDEKIKKKKIRGDTEALSNLGNLPVPNQGGVTNGSEEQQRFIPPESKSQKYIRTRQSVLDAHWTGVMNQFKRPSVLARSGLKQ